MTKEEKQSKNEAKKILSYQIFVLAYLGWVFFLRDHLSLPFFALRMFVPLALFILLMVRAKGRSSFPKDFFLDMTACVLLFDWMLSLQNAWTAYFPTLESEAFESSLFYWVLLGCFLGAVIQPFARLGIVSPSGHKIIKPRTREAFWGCLTVVVLVTTFFSLVNHTICTRQTSYLFPAGVEKKTWKNGLWDTCYLLVLEPWKSGEFEGDVIVSKEGKAMHRRRVPMKAELAHALSAQEKIPIVVSTGILGWRWGERP